MSYVTLDSRKPSKIRGLWCVAAYVACLSFASASWAGPGDDEHPTDPGMDDNASDAGAGEGVVDEWTKGLLEAIGLHNEARFNEDDIAEEAAELFEELLEEKPDHAIAIAYLGSSYALMARDASMVFNKTRYANRGIRYLDEAVELAPDDFTVLAVSTNVYKDLPKMFKRREKAYEGALAMDAIYSAEPSVRRAVNMVSIYDYLHEWAVEADDDEAAEAWRRKSEQAAEHAGDTPNID